jgi:hypothetical protein
MNSMKKMKRINEKYDKGVLDGMAGIYRPELMYGVFRKVYKNGHKQGSRMRRLADFKIK